MNETSSLSQAGTDDSTATSNDHTIAGVNESKRTWLWRIAIACGLILPTIGIFLAPTGPGVGGSAIILMFVLMLIRIPVALALSIPGLIGIYSLNGTLALGTMLKTAPLAATSQWSLAVLPMYLLMGLLLWQSGITAKLYVTARNWIGWLPGGLAVGTNLAGAGLASISGSTVGTTYALARIGIPEMLKAGYGKTMAIGSVIVAGLPGQLIPPSIFLVIVAGLLEVPVGSQLIAGVVPGLFVAAMFGLMLIAMAVFAPKMVGKDKNGEPPRVTWTERWRSLADAWPVGALVIAVIGGMISGVFTATEAGAVGALGALVFLLWFQRKNHPWKKLRAAAVDVVSSVGAIFLMILGSSVLSALIAVTGLNRVFEGLVSDTGMGRVGLLILIMVAYILLGMFMDPLAILLTTIPILTPMLNALGVDPLWFGVFAVFMSELAILTPPVGMLSFVIHKIAQEPEVNLGQKITLGDVFKAVGVFLPMAVIVTIVWIFIPEIVTWLPSML